MVSNSALPADRPAVFLVKNRLRRLGGRVNADETPRIGEQADETVREDAKCALDDDEIERPESGGPAVERAHDHMTFARS